MPGPKDAPLQDVEPTPSHFETSSLTTTPEILLLEAARQGNATEVRRLLDEGRFRIESKDPTGQTPLHLAILNGHTDLVQCLVEEYNADIDEATHDGSTPLHLAVNIDSRELIEVLISLGGDVDSMNEDSGATPLHIACELGNIQITEVLLENDANIDARRLDGYTPLFISVTSGQSELTECLLQHQADKTLRLPDGTSVEEAAGGNEDIIQLLKTERLLFKGPEIYDDEPEPEPNLPPIQHPPPPTEDDKLQACHGFEATVIQFSISERERRSHRRVSIYDLLYGKGSDVSAFPGLQDLQTGDGKIFTWYHLPANNMTWVETLIVKLIAKKIPNASMPDANFKSNLSLSTPFGDYEQSQSTHSSFQRPPCRRVEHPDEKFAWGTPEKIVTFVSCMPLHDMIYMLNTFHIPLLHYELYDDYKTMAATLGEVRKRAITARRTNRQRPLSTFQETTTTMPPPPPPPPPPQPSATPATVPSPPILSKLAQDEEVKRGTIKLQVESKAIDLTIKDRGASHHPTGEIAPALTQDVARDEETTTVAELTHDNAGISRLAANTEEPRRKLRFPGQDALLEYRKRKKSRKAKRKFFHHATPGNATVELENPHASLIRGYTIPEEPGQLGLQPRRTLDQYFYSRLENTSHRDQDQVVYRYLKKDARRPKIFMVDQLWLWVLNGDTIITCCPIRWQAWVSRSQQPTAGTIPMLWGAAGYSREPRVDSNDNTYKGRKRESKVPKLVQNDPMNAHQKILKHLRDPARKPITSVYDLANIVTNYCVNIFDEYSIPEDYHFFSFFEHSIGNVNEKATICLQEFRQNIHKVKGKKDAWRLIDMSFTDETDLLVEIEDIQDELNILQLVLSDQQNTVKQLSNIIDSITNQDESLTSSRRFDSSSIENRLTHVKLMQGMAKKTRDSLYNLVDLKQKQANSFEASAARAQAELAAEQTEESARQSKTLVVFTVVTIVFLPLSFMAAFFAIPLDVFPTDDNQKLELGYVLKYMLSIAFASAIPFVWLAFKIDDLSRTMKELLGKKMIKISPRNLLLVILCVIIFIIVIPVIIWTTQLATSLKLTLTVCMAILVLTAIISIGVRNWIYAERGEPKVLSMSSNNTTSFAD